TTTTATGSSFQYDRIPNLISDLDTFFYIFQQAFRTRNSRNTGFFHSFLSRSLVTHLLNLLSGSTDKFNTVLTTNRGKSSIPRKKTVAWVYDISICQFSIRNNIQNIQIRIVASWWAKTYRFIRK